MVPTGLNPYFHKSLNYFLRKEIDRGSQLLKRAGYSLISLIASLFFPVLKLKKDESSLIETVGLGYDRYFTPNSYQAFSCLF